MALSSSDVAVQTKAAQVRWNEGRSVGSAAPVQARRGAVVLPRPIPADLAHKLLPPAKAQTRSGLHARRLAHGGLRGVESAGRGKGPYLQRCGVGLSRMLFHHPIRPVEILGETTARPMRKECAFGIFQ